MDSPAQRIKKEKKRRKVERNTKLSRSLDSLKELHGKQTNMHGVSFGQQPIFFTAEPLASKFFITYSHDKPHPELSKFGIKIFERNQKK